MKYRASADEEEEAELKFAAQGVPGSGAGLNRTSWSPDARFLACGLFLGGWHGDGCVLFFFCSVMGHLFFPPPRTLPCTHTLRQRESEREREREREQIWSAASMHTFSQHLCHPPSESALPVRLPPPPLYSSQVTREAKFTLSLSGWTPLTAKAGINEPRLCKRSLGSS